MPWEAVVTKFNSWRRHLQASLSAPLSLQLLRNLSPQGEGSDRCLECTFTNASHAEPKKADKQHEKQLALAV